MPRVEALLTVAGVKSLALHDAADTPLLEPAPGRAPLWPEVEIHALLGADADAPGIAAWLDGALEGAGAVRVEAAGEAGPAARAPPGPQRIGRRLLLLPADTRARPDERVAVRLHMGLAFGTGEHPTTRMCLEWLERALAPGANVVDYGCGSGVLAIAAVALGAARAVAVDIDPQALRATADNAALNGVADALVTAKPDELTGGSYDVIVANVLAVPLIGLVGTFRRLLGPGGRVVLSGILDAQADRVISAYASSFDRFERFSSEGWSLVTAAMKGPAAGARNGGGTRH